MPRRQPVAVSTVRGHHASPTACASPPTPCRMSKPPRSASGSTPARATRPRPSNGISHMLEHMAFKGTDAALGPADRRGDRDMSAATSTPTPRARPPPTTPACSRKTCALAVDIVADILQNSVFDPDELERERGVILQEIGQALDTPDDLVFDQFQADRLSRTSRSAVPCWARPTSSRRSAAPICSPSWRATTRRRNMVVAAAGNVDHDQSSSWPRRISARPAAHACRAGARTARLYVGGDMPRAPRARAGPSRAGLPGHRLSRSGLLRRAVSRPCSAAACPRACSRNAREARALLFDLFAFLGLSPTAASSASMPATGDDDAARPRRRRSR